MTSLAVRYGFEKGLAHAAPVLDLALIVAGLASPHNRNHPALWITRSVGANSTPAWQD